MNISPIASYKQDNNEPAFQAVIEKYITLAKEDIKYYKNIGGNTLSRLNYDVFFKNISAQDGVDTLKEIRKLIGGKMDEGFNHILSALKKEAKRVRQEERREAKKSKSCQ